MYKKLLITGGSGFLGGHLIEWYSKKKYRVINIDKNPPQDKSTHQEWCNCDILNNDSTLQVLNQFSPSIVIHMAARTTMDGKSLDDYSENIKGTESILNAIKKTPSVKRVIITSSQHVRKPGSPMPVRDNDYNPLGFYGQSKAIMEDITRSSGMNCVWTIIRPTSIWGPEHRGLSNGLWKIIWEGKYFHPKIKPVIRSYGYIENTIWQVDKILNAPEYDVNGKTYYIGEAPIDQLDWVNAFSVALTGKKVRIVPARYIYLLALIGDFLSKLQINFPINTSRYRNMISSNIVPTDETIRLFGQPPFNLQQAVNKTVKWFLENQDRNQPQRK